MLKSMVGYCCPIETQIYQGEPGFTATGNLDPKLEESIRIVFGLLKTRFKDYSIDPNLLFDYHFHIHFQNTNLYKSGSGWDLGIFVSILSTLLHIPLPGTLTFSGQLSLSGKNTSCGWCIPKITGRITFRYSAFGCFLNGKWASLGRYLQYSADSVGYH